MGREGDGGDDADEVPQDEFGGEESHQREERRERETDRAKHWSSLSEWSERNRFWPVEQLRPTLAATDRATETQFSPYTVTYRDLHQRPRTRVHASGHLDQPVRRQEKRLPVQWPLQRRLVGSFFHPAAAASAVVCGCKANVSTLLLGSVWLSDRRATIPLCCIVIPASPCAPLTSTTCALWPVLTVNRQTPLDALIHHRVHWSA